MTNEGRVTAADKLVSLSDLAERLATLSSASVVLCHGVFDLLHIGHIKYFQEAKSYGDILVVTITPDAFVNKGPDRPVFTASLRADAIAALDVVDFVAVNEWPTAIETIDLLKPAVYVKGADYRDHADDVTGNIGKEQAAVEAIGGQIRYTGTPLFSSSTLINDHFQSYSESQKAMLSQLKSRYSFADIAAYFEAMTSLRVLSIGEAIVDEYILCETLGKSGKEPILMSKEVRRNKYAGGILAIANHLSGFVSHCDVLTYLGDDPGEDAFIRDHLREGVYLQDVRKKQAPTIVKKRFVESFNLSKLFGTYVINERPFDADEEAQLIARYETLCQEADLILMADYGHGLVTRPFLDRLFEDKSRLVVNTQVNAGNIGFYTISRYEQASMVCIHEGELRQEYRDRQSPIKDLIQKLYADRGYDSIVITQGLKGATALIQGQDWMHCPAFSGKVMDRIGAGDTFFALFSLCHRVDMPIDLALFVANMAGAYSVSQVGTGDVLSPGYLKRAMESMLK